ncbi:hypothetical protein FIBSPDRAFT_862383 [Athelia psychrophila]|uniref:Uncharacterized protein n=1 Tax=Athelia psychrophila TaxID=1759441 RepID=A0A166ID04_9AGAM|nr:hypothetical protein FIBSPDRAFT_862383 [Fibularhizoctonia sp. CBS 109695]
MGLHLFCGSSSLGAGSGHPLLFLRHGITLEGSELLAIDATQRTSLALKRPPKEPSGGWIDNTMTTHQLLLAGHSGDNCRDSARLKRSR